MQLENEECYTIHFGLHNSQDNFLFEKRKKVKQIQK